MVDDTMTHCASFRPHPSSVEDLCTGFSMNYLWVGCRLYTQMDMMVAREFILNNINYYLEL